MVSAVTERMAQLFEDALMAQGVDVDDLDAEDLALADGVVRGLAVRVGARRQWEEHVGSLLTNTGVQRLTGWSKQAVSKAVSEGRLLRLRGPRAGASAYPLSAFDQELPARPLPGLATVLMAFNAVDPSGWTAASWLTTPQVELDGETPRHRLMSGASDAFRDVSVLARQACDRLAA